MNGQSIFEKLEEQYLWNMIVDTAQKEGWVLLDFFSHSLSLVFVVFFYESRGHRVR